MNSYGQGGSNCIVENDKKLSNIGLGLDPAMQALIDAT